MDMSDFAAAPPMISGQRLLDEIAELATFGRREDGGVDRVAGSAADLAARAWLAAKITEAGLATWTDQTGNVFGNKAASAGPWLLLGSHTDTVPAAGTLDGAYGVLAALEVLRTLNEAKHPATDAIQIVSFWDEEGALPTSNGGLVGSTALTTSDHIHNLLGYLELHIEQGPRMTRAGLELAVVTGIVGIDRYAITIHGQANHAGTTPMTGRANAGHVAAHVASQVRDIALRISPSMVSNVGTIELFPGAPNVIPGLARLTIEFRCDSALSLAAAAAQLGELATQAAAAEGCTARFEQLSTVPVTQFDPDLCSLLDRICQRGGHLYGHLQSYAGHDAGPLSRAIPTAMLFVPSTDGISHSPDEHTPDPLLIQGCQTLLNAAVEFHTTCASRPFVSRQSSRSGP